MLNEIFEIIIENKEWLFSGIGNSIGSKFLNSKKKTIDSYTNVVNYNINLKGTDRLNSVNDVKGDIDNQMSDLVDRFISIYGGHGILVSQIPFFVSDNFNFRLSSFKDKNSILNLLDEKIMNWTCNVFGVERAWLDGSTNRIYKYMNYYKRINKFIEAIFELKSLYGNELDAIFIKSGELNPNKYGENYVIVIIRYPIKKINGNTIYKHIPISTNWDWGYWRSRYQLKFIIYICRKLNIYIEGYDSSLDTIYKISGGLVFPSVEINEQKLGCTWYPEDYVSYLYNNQCAKEIDEIDIVRKYFEDEGYIKYFNRMREKFKI